MRRVLILTFFLIISIAFGVSAQGQTAISYGEGGQKADLAINQSAEPNVRLTLDEVISQAQSQSIAAMTAKYTFLSSYWSYRSYKASRLPSLNFSGHLLNFDRSMRLLQDYNTGEMRYLENYSLENTLGLSVKQNIAFTGGTLSLYSSLNRLDQFGDNRLKSYYSQPITLSYTQPLFSYNSFKWAKKIEPKEFELAKRQYIESMEDVTLRAVNYFFSLVLSRTRYDIAVNNYANTCSLHNIAKQRLELGTITKDELLQLELRMLNDSLSINTTSLSLREQQMRLNSFLRLKEQTYVTPEVDESIPLVNVNYDLVLSKALANSSFELNNEIQILNADSDVARAKADRGASASLNARFGLSQTGDKFSAAYANLLDQEVVGLNFSIPIFDWGMGKGRVKMAKARAEMVRSQIEQREIDFRHEIYTLIEQFTNQRNQCDVARRARNIADDRYAIAMENFRQGKISVTEMNTAQSEKDSANQAYMSALSQFWQYYYELRGLTLYDFIHSIDIVAEFDKIIEQQ